MFREFRLNSLDVSRINNEFKIVFCLFSLKYHFLVNSLSILKISFLYRKFTTDPLFFWEFTLISLSFLRNYYKSSIFHANMLYSHYFPREIIIQALFFRKFTMNSLSFSRIQFEFTIFFSNLLFFAN